jgi:hypothetical protein
MTIRKEDLDKSEVILFEHRPYLVPSGSYMDVKAKISRQLSYVLEIREPWMVEEASKTEPTNRQYDALRPFIGFLMAIGKDEIDGRLIKDQELLGRMSAAIAQDKI